MGTVFSRNGIAAAVRVLPGGLRETLQTALDDSWLRRKVDGYRLDRSLDERGGLNWHRSASCPQRLFDAGGAQIGDTLYVVCGYTSLDGSSRMIHGFDMRREVWSAAIPTPDGLASSHCAVTSDGERFLYFASGQVGAQCSPAVREAFCYDTVEDRWHDLPPVPEARYGATMQFWRGRLHLMGGAAEDRWTPAADHWSLGVSGGSADDLGWVEEQPVPVAGMHRGSVIFNDMLFLFGGQQGDFRPVPGDPACTCDGRTQETYLSCCFRLGDPSGPWQPVADLPVAVSHTDFSTVAVGDRIVLVGGQVYKNPERFYLRLTDMILSYDPAGDRWSVAGHLPYRLKIPVVGVSGETLFVTTGQRGKGRGDTPGLVVSDTWKAVLPPPGPTPVGLCRETLAGRNILLITHDLTRTGAPLLLMETARMMLRQGATVRVATLSDDAQGWNLASEYGIPRIPAETAVALARDADNVIVNTTSTQSKDWVSACLDANPDLARKITWWVHEIDVEHHLEGTEPLGRVAQAIFDSAAARDAWAEQVRLPDAVHVIHPALADGILRQAAAERHPFPANRRQSHSRNMPLLTRAEIRERLDVAPDELLLCSIGTFVDRKGQRLLIRSVAAAAAERNLPVKLLIVGLLNKQQHRSVLADLSADERRVLAPSRLYVSQSELAAFYAASDVYVVNSQGTANGRGECFGRTTIEAMAFGLPVLGTNAGGTAEIVEDGVTGLLFPVGEAGQHVLAEQIAQLAAAPEDLRRLGDAGRSRALERFHYTRFIGEYEKALMEVSASAAPAPN